MDHFNGGTSDDTRRSVEKFESAAKEVTSSASGIKEMLTQVEVLRGDLQRLPAVVSGFDDRLQKIHGDVAKLTSPSLVSYPAPTHSGPLSGAKVYERATIAGLLTLHAVSRHRSARKWIDLMAVFLNDKPIAFEYAQGYLLALEAADIIDVDQLKDDPVYRIKAMPDPDFDFLSLAREGAKRADVTEYFERVLVDFLSKLEAALSAARPTDAEGRQSN